MLNEFAKDFERKVWFVLVVDKCTEHVKPHFDLFFYHNINIKEIVLFQSASWKRNCATHWREQRSMDSSQISQSDCEIFCNCGKKGRNPSLLLWWLCLIFAWWNCLLSFKFTQIVTSLLWVSRKRLQVFQNLTRAQQVFGVSNTCNVLISPLNHRGSDMGIGNFDAFLFVKFEWRSTIMKVRLDREGELAYSLTFDFPKSSSS